MRPNESLVSSVNKTHMGRSEAPLSRDPKEETPGRANRKQLSERVSKMPSGGDYTLKRDEKLRGVESKFNERDLLSKTGNSIQTTLLSTSQQKSLES